MSCLLAMLTLHELAGAHPPPLSHAPEPAPRVTSRRPADDHGFDEALR